MLQLKKYDEFAPKSPEFVDAQRLRLRNNLYSVNYKEIPATLDQFIKDPRYLGRATIGQDGVPGSAVFPVWQKEIPIFFSNNDKPFIVLTGAIGGGKSFAAVISILYVMHLHLCLRSPWGYYGLANASKMSIAFFNLTKTLSDSKGYGTMQKFLTQSPWFMEHGHVRGKDEKREVHFDLFEYVLASPYSRGFGTVGKDIIAAIMDEVDSNTESENQKRRVLLAYESTVIRFESRFMREGKSLGRFFLVASKQDTVSFINTYVEKNKNTGRIHVVDKPAWEMKRGVMKYSGETFPVMVGDQFTPSKILYTQEEKALAIADRLHVIDVPIEYRFSFEMDITGALRDIAGISVTYTRQTKYLPNTKILIEAFTNDKPLFPAETLNVGCQEDYSLSVISLFINANLKIQKDLPRFIHADWAKSGDAFGLAMTALAGWTEINVEGTDGTFTKKKVPVVHTDFAIRFKAKPGDEIPLSIIRKFVLDLKGFGFNVRKYTSDLDIASTSDRQILSQSGIECEYLSVDRTMTPYLEWKNMLQERRWSMPRHDFLLFEVSNLNIDRDKGKIDHPDEVVDALFVDGMVKDVVMSGSKDTADAVVGSVYALTSSLVEKDQPMDVEAMKNILSRIHDGKSSDEDKVTAFATMNGQFVSMGTGAGMVKFKNILRSVRK